jgi:hypothetical protein
MNGSRSATNALLVVMAAATLAAGAAGGYWVRGFAPAPAQPSVTRPAAVDVEGPAAPVSTEANEQFRQRLIEANQADGAAAPAAAPAVHRSVAQHYS